LEVPAHVYSIGAITRPGGMRAQFVKEIPIRLKLDGLDPRIIPDLSVSADVVVESEQQAQVAPRGAVFSDDDGRTNYVYVQSGNEWERRPVELGLANNLNIAIRSGLRSGEVVALERPPQNSKPG
jgi:HlyD family secretion protein